ncbi:histidine phosphatase family protein [Nonomuraea sp. SYSU D8015]|uniref:histidine phosphatase family protein n=1 Tax=Nonomuraea sp. SYSU D8015 TaxID=2593644 RepID=UPI00166070B9|nr:histidine phosphatase family protein [Nonomuraea sp. SYSU D8015]
MLFVRHATTPGMRAACFPGGDEDADAASLARAAAVLAPLATDSGAVAWVAPSGAARQTAAAAGLVQDVVPALAEADFGRWRGLPYGQVAREEPDALASWLTDPHAAPHGGESLAGLAARVAGWLGTLEPAGCTGVAVCDVGVIRAVLGHVLGLGPSSAALFDLAPLSVTELVATRDGWRVAYVNRKALS